MLRTLMHGDPETTGINSSQQVDHRDHTNCRVLQTDRHTPPRLLWNPIGSSGKISHFTPPSRNNGTVTQQCNVYNTPGSPSIAHTCHCQSETHVESAGYGIQVCACTHTHRHTHTQTHTHFLPTSSCKRPSKARDMVQK